MCSNFTVIAAKLISYLVLQLIFVYIVTSEIGVCHIKSNFRSSSHCRRNNRTEALSVMSEVAASSAPS